MKEKTLNSKSKETAGKPKVSRHKSARGSRTDCICKRAQRVRNTLPSDPKAWAETVSHVINNTTPTRKSMLNTPNQGPSYFEEVKETLNINKTGRPTHGYKDIKRKLAYSQKADKV